jgi:hypothetical protein
MQWDVTSAVQDIVDSVVANEGWLILDPVAWNQVNIPIAYFRANLASGPQGVIDHYKVYNLLPETAPIPGVLLEDQFGASDVDLLSLAKLGVPVSKAIAPDQPSGALQRPDEHLSWYELVDIQAPRTVNITNQFGEETWTVKDGAFLLVPAIKDGQGVLELNQHWKCYDVVSQPEPPGVTVNLQDQFHLEEDVLVGPGRYLCNPVEKNEEGPPVFPDEHLACYDIVDDPLQQVHTLEDQFGLHPDLVVENPELLCLPSTKEQVLGDVDHYRLYNLFPEDLPQPFPQFALDDQFDSVIVELTALEKIGVPVSKAHVPDLPSGNLVRPDEHLAWYGILTDPQPPRVVHVENQFGIGNWSLQDGAFLLVPAIKDGVGQITLGQHWKCYHGVQETGLPDIAVNLVDQFQEEYDVIVGPGRYLCNPAEKNGEGPPGYPDEHLACYDAIGTPLGELHHLDDQLGPHPDLLVENPEAICVPSLKYLPEPGFLVSFGSCVALLTWLDCRRRRRATDR